MEKGELQSSASSSSSSPSSLPVSAPTSSGRVVPDAPGIRVAPVSAGKVAPSSAGRGGNNGGRSKSGGGPSQARKRLEAMTASIDRKLTAALSMVLLLYVMITFGTWMHIENQDYRSSPVRQAITARHSVAKTTRIHNAYESIKLSLLRGARKDAEEARRNQEQEHGENQQGGDNSIRQAKEMDSVSDSITVTLRYDEVEDVKTLQHLFPVHVGDDMEEINHPGIFMADKSQYKQIAAQHPELPKDGRMRVPKFWRPKAYGPEGVRVFLGNYGERLITPEEAAQIGSFDKNGRETIYISVASYRDPECQPTVEDMFLRAKYPERLRVAIIDQRADNDPVPPCGAAPVPCDKKPEQAMCRFAHLIDVYEVPAPLSIGPVFARHLANRMYRGEYFAMQVDSHVRFIRDWDEDIVKQWKSARNEMGVMSVYLSDITDSIDPVTFENKHPTRPIMCKTDYESNGKLRHLRHGQQPEGIPGIHGEPTLHPFWAAGFSFARGHFVVQVPYDQYQPMVFQGEEIFIGLRGFTYGYDYYTPETSVAFHMYAIKDNAEKRKKVKLFWENQNLYPGSAIPGMKRLNGIIGMGDPGDEYYHGDEKEYGLGKVRPKEKFFKLYGIHTDTQTVENHLCQFVGRPMQKMFVPHLRANGMGIDYTEFEFEWKDPNPPPPEKPNPVAQQKALLQKGNAGKN